MKYEEFKNYLQVNIKEYLPYEFKDSKIEFMGKYLNNGEYIEGIRIDNGGNLSPIIYIDQLYIKYSKGGLITDICKEIADTRINKRSFNINIDDVMVYEKIKSEIFPILINREKNKEVLKERINTDFLDLSITYAVNVGIIDGNKGVIHIKDDLLNIWGITKEELHNDAVKNIENDILFMGISDLLNAPDMPGTKDIYVLTNKSKTNGAINIINPFILNDLKNKLGHFYILPSSVHEVLIVPEKNMEKDTLVDMVRDVNNNEVALDEILSFSVYKYTDKLEIA